MTINSKHIVELFKAISEINWLKKFNHFASNPYTWYVYGWFNRYLSYYGKYFVSEYFIKENKCIVKRHAKKFPVLMNDKILYVYNIDSIKNLPPFEEKEERNILYYMEEVNKYLDRNNINEVVGENMYYPMQNCIRIKESKTSNQRFDWFYHEVIHSTWHHARLNRPLKEHTRWMLRYDEEEMIAIIGSSLLSGNRILLTSINYIRKHIESPYLNKEKILHAFEQAWLAVDYILSS